MSTALSHSHASSSVCLPRRGPSSWLAGESGRRRAASDCCGYLCSGGLAAPVLAAWAALSLALATSSALATASTVLLAHDSFLAAGGFSLAALDSLLAGGSLLLKLYSYGTRFALARQAFRPPQ